MTGLSTMHDSRQIISQRLYNQHISQATFEKPEEVVRWMGAVQAQDFLYSLWAIGLRMSRSAGMSEADVEQAIADRTIVRTWPMRGTIHYVPAEDTAWMLKLLAKRVIRGNRSVHRKAGLDDMIIKNSKKVLTKALPGKRLTRKEVCEALEQAGIAANHSTQVGTRGMHIINRLALEGLICFGPRRGKQSTFVLLDEWVPNPNKLEDDEALAELTMRYFRSHGPATEYDFAWWSGLTVTNARSAIDMVKSTLEEETIDDNTYWFTEPMTTTPKEFPIKVYLLPYLDEYTVGYKDRSILVEPEVSKQIYEGNNQGILWPVIVIDGQVVGTWKRTLKRRTVEIATTLFRDLGKTESDALTKAVENYGRFLGMAVSLT